MFHQLTSPKSISFFWTVIVKLHMIFARVLIGSLGAWFSQEDSDDKRFRVFLIELDFRSDKIRFDLIYDGGARDE